MREVLKMGPTTTGEALKYWRLQRFMTQAELAKAAGLSEQTILRIEKGTNHPHIPTLRKLAAALDIDPSRLV